MIGIVDFCLSNCDNNDKIRIVNFENEGIRT